MPSFELLERQNLHSGRSVVLAMATRLIQQELRRQAVEALSESLGPVDALRFLALVSRERFDLQQWRREYFSRWMNC